MTKQTQFVSRGGITNHRLIAYFLGNISVKNLRRSYSVLHQCRFLKHSVYTTVYKAVQFIGGTVFCEIAEW